MRTTTGRCRAQQLRDAADLPRQHMLELVPLLRMDRDLWIRGLGRRTHTLRRLEVVVPGTARNLRDARSVGPAGKVRSVDHEVSNVSAHLRRERSKTLRISLFSQIRALPQFWGLSASG
jgi:hypothetical protein